MPSITLVVLPGSFGTGVSATLDILRTAKILAERSQLPALRWRVCSPEGGITRLQSGLMLETSRLRASARPQDDIWVIPGLALNSETEVLASASRPDMAATARALRLHHRRGGRIAAGCSAVFLLQHAGLLDGRLATTTWWLAPLLQRLNPRCRVESARMVCSDDRLLTAGAAFAQTDLMLHLLHALYGPPLVDGVSRLLLLDARDAQSRYLIPELLAGGDALVSRLTARIEQALPDLPTVARLAAEFKVSERTLGRHVRHVTGQGTLALIQSIRLRKARTLLEQSRMSVENVAAAVGYGDATALRRLLRKAVGSSPRQLRAPPARLTEYA